MRRAVSLVGLSLVMGLAVWGWLRLGRIRVREAHLTQPADGREHVVAVLGRRWPRRLRAEDATANGERVRLADKVGGTVQVWVRMPVTPGRLTVRASGLPLTVRAEPSVTDRYGDGTPDWMRLHTAEDRRAFRAWFTEVAERAADAGGSLPPEVMDCASLLRYAYREALRAHDARWYAQFPAGAMPAMASVQQWTYPNTPLGTGLFRVRPGPFQAEDAQNGVFAQFADAKTLYQDDAFRLGRDVRMAQPGDLIFYRVLEEDSQYHSMIVTGDEAGWVVYHTGPIGGHKGEMRRVLLSDLLRHPDARWRPVVENPNFLGVYRWNILREE